MARWTNDDLDAVLAIQLAVAVAGEWGDVADRPAVKLGWWRTDLVSDLGGHDLLQRLAPATWRWAALRAARLAAQRVETERFGRALGDASRAVGLYRLGPAADQALEDRLLELTTEQADPATALPALAPWIASDDPADFDRSAFATWLGTLPDPGTVADAPAGRRLDVAGQDLRTRAGALARALLPLPSAPDGYPSPWIAAA